MYGTKQAQNEPFTYGIGFNEILKSCKLDELDKSTWWELGNLVLEAS